MRGVAGEMSGNLTTCVNSGWVIGRMSGIVLYPCPTRFVISLINCSSVAWPWDSMQCEHQDTSTINTTKHSLLNNG